MFGVSTCPERSPIAIGPASPVAHAESPAPTTVPRARRTAAYRRRLPRTRYRTSPRSADAAAYGPTSVWLGADILEIEHPRLILPGGQRRIRRAQRLGENRKASAGRAPSATPNAARAARHPVSATNRSLHQTCAASLPHRSPAAAQSPPQPSARRRSPALPRASHTATCDRFIPRRPSRLRESAPHREAAATPQIPIHRANRESPSIPDQQMPPANPPPAAPPFLRSTAVHDPARADIT